MISLVIWKESTPLSSPPEQFREGLGVLSDKWLDIDVSVIIKKEIVEKQAPLGTLITNTPLTTKLSGSNELEILGMGITMLALVETIVYSVRELPEKKKKEKENKKKKPEN